MDLNRPRAGGLQIGWNCLTLDHLPEDKQEELKSAVDIIREYSTPEMIILFGSFAKGDWVEEKADDGVHYKYQSDFDIFVVIETEHQAMKLEENRQLRTSLRQVLRTPVSLIAHDIQFFNRRLRKGQYFFSDIKNEGILLFNSGNFELAEAKELSFQEREKMDEEDFEYWFKSSIGFFGQYESALDKSENSIAAFLLHQTTERLYSAILLVYTRYKYTTHDLEKLSALVTSVEPKFLTIFPQGTEEERKRFDLLRKAYVDARYKPSYEISREDLEWLGERVKELRKLTEERCKEKIKYFESQIPI